jgi:lipopolysaccharide transport system ATP-binding protein
VSVPTGWPTILHITHYKAGSQWIYAILHRCARERIVKPRADLGQFLHEPVLAGRVYPTLYVTYEEYRAATLPADHTLFVVFRDLRDTLVSYYFSIKNSHPVMSDAMAEMRRMLQSCDTQTGLRIVMDGLLGRCAEIQRSWLDAGVPFLRYEDLLTDDVALLTRTLIDECRLPIDRDELRKAIESQRFENKTGGRQRGQEDEHAHERKATPGDWRNHFTPALAAEFNERFGRLLIQTAYEVEMEW